MEHKTTDCSFYLKQHLAEVETTPDGSTSLMLKKERYGTKGTIGFRATIKR